MRFVSGPVLRRLRAVASLPELPGDRYTLDELLGEGGMGAVYAAHDDSLQREVAIKVIHAQGNDGQAERLRREALVLARLEHPGIVPVHDVGLLRDGRLFYVMKRVRGQTLSAWLREFADLDRRLSIFERICETVAFAHQHGVVHRDLKPDNIMVGAFGEVLVLDWGLARILTDHGPEQAVHSTSDGRNLTQAGTRLGTAGYMAPEQARGEPVDERADVYALGATLHQVLLDEAPPGEDVTALLLQRRDVPRRLRAICALALAGAPAERYTTVSELADDIARYRAGLPVQAYRENLFDRLQRWFDGYRGFILLVLAYLLMRVVTEVVAAVR